jgi:hypothetical protein
VREPRLATSDRRAADSAPGVPKSSARTARVFGAARSGTLSEIIVGNSAYIFAEGSACGQAGRLRSQPVAPRAKFALHVRERFDLVL